MAVQAGRVIRRITVSVLAAGLVVSGQVAVAAGPSAPAGAASGGVVTVSNQLEGTINPIEFDPVQFTGPAGFFSYDWPIYGGLLRETASGSYVPDLASSVTVPDPSTIDITLRPGLVYSNGAPLDANAVKAGFERNLTNPKPGAWDTSMYQLTGIDVTGPTSLVLHFSQPVASTFYPLLGDQEGFMALPTGPSTGAQNTNVVGAGPFKLQSFTPGERLVLVKNPKYWDARDIHASGITFVNVPQGPQQINALETGLVDVQGGLTASDIPTLKNIANIKINSIFPDANYFYVPICKASGPLASLKVRQALNYATNRVAINNALFYGKGQPAWSLFPSTAAYYDPSLTNIYAYNVKKAKQLMAQAGYPNGFSTSLMALPEASTNQLAPVLQAEWKQIGVNLTIVPTSNYVTDLYRNHGAEMGLNPSGLTGIQKLTTMYIPGSVGDICNYSSPTMNSLLQQIESLPPNSPKLKAAWIQAQDFVVKNALGIYVVYGPLITAAKKTVKGLQVIPYVGGVLNYWSVSVGG